MSHGKIVHKLQKEHTLLYKTLTNYLFVYFTRFFDPLAYSSVV